MLTNKILMGIDPGIDRVGWAVGNKNGNQIVATDYGCIQTDRNQSDFQRYEQIEKEITEIVAKHTPQICGIEKLYFSKNVTNAMKVSQARGIIISALLKANVEILELSPQAVKLAATGYGKADKAAMTKMVKLQFKLEDSKILDDTIDALAILLAIPNYQ